VTLTPAGQVARLATCFVLLAGVGCGDNRSGVDANGAPYSVATETIVLEDESRPTAPTATSAGAPSRTILTDVHVPVGSGSFPLVVMSHGLRSHPSKLAALAMVVASAGYVVAAPAYPLTNSAAPDGGVHPEDVVQQPGDLRFILDELLRLSDEAGGPLSQRVDGEKIALLGSSLGAITSLATTFHSCCRDDRIDAVIAMSGLLLAFPGGEYDVAGSALLLVHGDQDDVVPHSGSAAAFELAAPPKWFLSILGGRHGIEGLGIQSGGENLPEISAVILDFLDVYVRGNSSVQRLIRDGTVEGLSSLRYETQ
jgi:dienelactone hydrolase